MEHIKMTDEIKARVLSNLCSADLQPKRRGLSLKRWAALAACAALLLVGGRALTRHEASESHHQGQVMQGRPDIVTAESAQQLEQAVGFSVEKFTTLPFPVEKTTWEIYWKTLAQVKYEGAGQSAVLRKSAGAQDNSGVYGEYAQTVERQEGPMSITLKGNDNGFTLGIWTNGNYVWSLNLSQALPEDQWLTLIRETIP